LVREKDDDEDDSLTFMFVLSNPRLSRADVAHTLTQKEVKMYY